MDASVESYFQRVPPNRKSRLLELQGLILNLYPEAVVDLTYNMQTYRVTGGWVALANQKQ